MTVFGLDAFNRFIQAYSLRLRALQDTLNTLDNRIGDGDHGTNMARGFAAAQQKLDAQPPADLSAASMSVAMALLGHVGGASGPLYGTVFMKLGGVLGHRTEADESLLVEALTAANQGIVERGKAEFGEKTMLDVWDPVVTYLQEHRSMGLFDNMTDRIRDAVLATRDRIATKGRAAYLGPRSQGTCDPGSVSSGLFFEELARACGKEMDDIPWETLV